MHDPQALSLTIHASYDSEHEAVGLTAQASDAFDDGPDTRGKIEILAAITAKANSIAAQVIRTWEAGEDRRRELYDHYATLKEQMLQDMLERIDSHPQQP